MPDKPNFPPRCAIADYLRLRTRFEAQDAPGLAQLLTLQLRPGDRSNLKKDFSDLPPEWLQELPRHISPPPPATFGYPAELPKLRFLRYLGRRQRPGVNRPFSSPATQVAETEQKQTYRRKAIPQRPLQPWTAIWPLLKTGLSRHHPSKCIDLPKLIGELGSGRPLRQIPMRAIKSWPQQIVVVMDDSPHLRPVQADFLLIIESLLGWFRERITLYLIEDSGFQEIHAIHPTGTIHHRRFPRLPPNAALLVLSDLGLHHPQRQSHINWQGWGRDLNREGHRPLALLPVHPSRWRRSVTRHFQCLLFDHHPGAQRQLAQPLEKDKEAEALLTLLAPMARITPALLRQARIEHPQGLSISAELSFWARADFGGARTFREWQDTNLQRHYLSHLAQAPSLLELARRLLEHHEESLPMRCQVEQRQLLSAHLPLSLTDRQRGYLQQQQRLMGNMEDDERRFFSNWMAHLEEIKGESVWLQEIEPLYRHYYQTLSSQEKREKEPPSTTGRTVWYEVVGGVQGRVWLKKRGGEDAPLKNQGTARIPAAGGLTLRGYVVDRGREQKRWQQRIDPDDPPMEIEQSTTRFTLTDASWIHEFDLIHCPPWASGIGRDPYGLFVEVEVEGVSFVLRWIPPGEFLMGSPEEEPERFENEGPQHLVRFEQGFWLAETACTQALWQAVMGENPSRFKDNPENPVENVRWEDAQRFIEELNRRHPGLDLRLPSEAEWEYACRAGTTTPFWFGERLTTEVANYDGKHPYNNGPKGIYREKTMPVRSFRRNPWGLYQMHGNVWEWCQDPWHDDYRGAPADGRPWETGGDSNRHVCRGGSWFYDGRRLRSACRGGWIGFGDGRDGFRLARGPESSGKAGSGGGGAAGAREGRATPAGQPPPRREDES